MDTVEASWEGFIFLFEMVGLVRLSAANSNVFSAGSFAPSSDSAQHPALVVLDHIHAHRPTGATGFQADGRGRLDLDSDRRLAQGERDILSNSKEVCTSSWLPHFCDCFAR